MIIKIAQLLRNIKLFMKIITIANSKGGVGKSTILSNIIAQLLAMDFKVAFIDYDKQKSLTEWGKKIKGLKKIEQDNFNKKNLKKNFKYDFLCIDSPASIREKLLEKIIKNTDILIVPTSNSNIELRACKKFLNRIYKLKKNNDNNSVRVIRIMNRLRYSKNVNNLISSSEKIIDEQFTAWLPATKCFDDQMSVGSSINKSNYARKELIREQLLKLISFFQNK